MSDLNSGTRLRVGTWNLDRDKPLWRQPDPSAHTSQGAEVWLLTEAPQAGNWAQRSCHSGVGYRFRD